MDLSVARDDGVLGRQWHQLYWYNFWSSTLCQKNGIDVQWYSNFEIYLK